MKIAYRVVSSVLAAVILPVLIFTPMVSIVFSVLSGYPTLFSLAISDFFTQRNAPAEINEMLKTILHGEAVQQFIPFAIAFAVFMILAVIVALVILGFSIFSNMKKTIASLSVLALASMIGAHISFQRIATPLINGEVPIGDFLKGTEIGSVLDANNLLSGLGLGGISGLFGNLLNFSAADAVFSIDSFRLSTAYFLTIFAFIGILMWSVAYILAELGENDKKATKRNRRRSKS